MANHLAPRPALEEASPGFLPTATANERVAAMLAAGLAPGDLRKAVEVSEATIRSWSDAKSRPRERAARVLDDLRAVMIALDAAGVTEDRAIAWLTSRNFSRWLSGARPIEVLRADPLSVLATVEELIEAHADDQQAQALHLHVRRGKRTAAGSRISAHDARAAGEHDKFEARSRRRAEASCET